MKLIGNILWFVFGGFVWSIVSFALGIVACFTVIGIPIGLQMFKMAQFVLWPFGKDVAPVNPAGWKHILNLVWAVCFGWTLALAYLIIGGLFYITILGIPFGQQYVKMAHFVLLPLGNEFIAD